jgi:histone acetyltransferase (RNA polymerase elongator complex component)
MMQNKIPTVRSEALNDCWKENKKELKELGIDMQLFYYICASYSRELVDDMIYGGKVVKVGDFGNFSILKKKVYNIDKSKRRRLAFNNFILNEYKELDVDYTYSFMFKKKGGYGTKLMFKANRFIKKELYDKIMDIRTFKVNDNFRQGRTWN